MIPLCHDFTGARVLVFGGGTVGARKARRFGEEADTIVVSPTFADADFGDVERVRAAPDAADVGSWFDAADPALVVAATDDPHLNEVIEETAQDRGILVNRVDIAGGRDPNSVVVPATVRDDPVVVAIATGGTSPALSKHLRQRLEDELSDAGAMAELTATLRDQLDREEIPADRRHAIVTDVVNSDRVWKALDRGNTNTHQNAADLRADATGDSE